MEETGEPVYQYYTVINDNVTKIQAKDKLDENQVVYVALSGDFEEASTSEYVLNDENDEVKEEPVTLQQEFSTLPTIDTSNVKIITLNDGRVFVTTSAGGSSSEENYETIEPHLISDDVEEEEQTEDYSTTVHSNLKYEIIELVENPIEMVYCDDLDEETHMKKEKKFKCTFEGCTKEYSSSYQLNVHLRSHSTDEKAFKCTVEGCTKRFSTSYSLKAHIRTHTGEKPYGCSACLKNFKTSGDLLKHYRIHTGEKPFVCPVLGCGRSFTTSNIRKVHIRSHTGERPYACTYTNCGKAFSSLTNYKNHIRIHSGEKPYVCTVPECGKRFTEYSSLYKHNMVHQQSRPFVCPFCDQKFKQESAMKVHKRVKHNVILTSDGTEIVVDLN